MLAVPLACADQVQTEAGKIEGATSADGMIREFKGIPYAAPPVGASRWKPPQPAASWTDVRKTVDFAPRCMQGHIYDDMVFRDKGPSEDCLYLNVWAPIPEPGKLLPVMVWIHGGGFIAGASSEPRQDGENLARKGVIVVSMNYRLGAFGFLAHPDLDKESDHNASGNYGLLDQVAALQWVRHNIEAFGGDPNMVTVFGESAGSMSVCALLASPITDGLIERAIGESGSMFGARTSAHQRTIAELAGTELAKSLHVNSIAEMRAKAADEILNASMKPDPSRFGPDIDGYFLNEPVTDEYRDGMESHVPLLAGWNADEGSYEEIFGKEKPTARNFAKLLKKDYVVGADQLLRLYPASSDEEAKRSAADLAGDRFIAYGTWKWIEMHQATSQSPVYRYEFDQAPPAAAGGESHGAYHSADIEYVFGDLASKNLPWTADDKKLSDLMSSYWTNFAKTGDPNGPGLPKWPAYAGDSHYEVMHLKADPSAAPDAHRERYQYLDSLAAFR